MLRHTLAAIAALLLIGLSTGCDPCTDYCSLECSCAGDDSEGCVDTCMDTMTIYSGDLRTDECADRQEDLEETCTQGGS